MRVTMIKRLNTIISLWLLAVIAALVVIGLELEMNGFFVACGVVGVILLISNVITVTTGVRASYQRSLQRQKEFKNFQ